MRSSAPRGWTNKGQGAGEVAASPSLEIFRTQLEFPEHPELINNPAVGKGLDQRPPEAPSNLKRLVIIRHMNICVCRWCCRQTPRGDLYMI